MMTKHSINAYMKAQPFRPFRLHVVSGRTFDIRDPEMVKLLQSTLLVFNADAEPENLSDEWETVSLMLIESVSHLEASVH